MLFHAMVCSMKFTERVQLSVCNDVVLVFVDTPTVVYSDVNHDALPSQNECFTIFYAALDGISRANPLTVYYFTIYLIGFGSIFGCV